LSTTVTSAGPIEWLNKECFCITVDPEMLRRELEAHSSTRGLYDSLDATHPGLFAKTPVFVGRANVVAMQALVTAVESVVQLSAYRQTVLGWAPEIARFDPGIAGVLSSFDFHLTPDGPRLIEINTNAGGAFLTAVLSRAQHACCAPVLEAFDRAAASGASTETLTTRLFEMFRVEWARRRGHDVPLRRVAIVDDAPQQQYLYPEFLLAAQLFRSRGVEAIICDPTELAAAADGLRHESGHIDLVYNRLTDFALAEPQHAVLREAYLSGQAVVTPHPRAHALYADKRNLTVLSDAARLHEWGVEPATVATLHSMIPCTELVDPSRAEDLWTRRDELFFKPVAGFGGKATYRGAKLTRRVWNEILNGEYVAQALVPPSERSVRIEKQPAVSLKLDLRCYVYDGQVLSHAARLYQGQVTNFRTPGGGFASVFSFLHGNPPAAAR